ncbi:hypothetical protein EWM64_g8786 [Hericium alpestre]|uniref:Geranylgeranyl pyrophosphate synthetase n=1 Tax=Hericium alpestre TaxID=135208 RepID=A0A4Y9ZKA0_9AGAM|nr:hypothetical protein EWM64_g8786 [Hericium alpestre]
MSGPESSVANTSSKRGGKSGKRNRGRGRNWIQHSGKELIFSASREERLAAHNLPHDHDIGDGLLASSPMETLLPPHVGTTLAEGGIRNVEYIGSYDWTESEEPTIIVPGSPPRWVDRDVPFQLRPDEGVRIVDHNTLKLPSFPLLPLLTAVDIIEKDVIWPSIDFVSDRTNLRKLYKWIERGDNVRDFRIDFELVGERTVLLNRWEPGDRDVAGNGKTYGIAFERMVTRAPAGCAESLVHLRIIKYDFHGLKMIVRHKVDACLPHATERADVPSSPSPDDTLANTLDSLSIEAVSPAENKKQPLNLPAHGLRVVRGGSEVPQESVVELMTRSTISMQLDVSIIIPPVYLSQASHLHIGIHTQGQFSRIHRISTTHKSDSISAGEKQMNGDFEKLGMVLKNIQEIAIAHRNKSLSLVCRGGKLQVYEHVSRQSCLPDDVYRRFNAQ